jgi:hypothetical protein
MHRGRIKNKENTTEIWKLRFLGTLVTDAKIII